MKKRTKRDSRLGNRPKKGRYKRKPNHLNHDVNVRTYDDSPNYREEDIEARLIELRNNQNIILDENNDVEEAPNDDYVQPNGDDLKKQQLNLRQQKVTTQRWTVFHLFVHKYNGLDSEDGDYMKHWSGRGGIATCIRKDLGLDKNSGYKLIPIFEKIMECIRLEVDFNPSMCEKRGGNREMTIRMDSVEAQIIVDGFESGLSIKSTWENVNKHRDECNAELISESCVAYTLRKMKPKLIRIKKKKTREH